VNTSPVNRLAAATLCLLVSLHQPCLAAVERPAAALRNVVLLHGLARSSHTMDKLSQRLVDAGYRTCNIAYPSRQHSVETLAADYVLPAIEACFGGNAGAIDFVTHSLGGIIVRQLAASGSPIRFGRVVMLSPPNQGSQVVDKLGGLALFKAINGPAGQQLGTSVTQLPHTLGSANFELGVLTGNRSINCILSLLIPGDDDGKVAVENARLAGMQDFLVLPTSHPFIMKNRAAQAQVLHFLAHGAFLRD
jgi:triacylglycerol lipase